MSTLVLAADSLGFDPDAPLPTSAPRNMSADARVIQAQPGSYGDDPYQSPADAVATPYQTRPFITSVDWDEGGTFGPANPIGFNTGVDTLGAAPTPSGMTGEVVVPEDSQLILLTSDYGNVGLDDSSNRMAAAVMQQNEPWLPSDDSLALLSIQPAFGTAE